MPNVLFPKESHTFPLLITKNLQDKIKYLCNKLPNVEWSGTVFYKVEGNFNDLSLKITAIDMLVQDIGVATYTVFEHSPSLAGYINENKELLFCYMGLIHSHNNMEVFFSGTDLSTLESEGKDMPHFLSIITNNKHEFCAKITASYKEHKYIETKVTSSFYYTTFKDEIKSCDPEGTTSVKEESIIDQKVIGYSLDISLEDTFINPVAAILDAQLQDIKDAKSKATVTNTFNRTTTYNSTSTLIKDPIEEDYYNDYYDNISYWDNNEIVDNTDINIETPYDELLPLLKKDIVKDICKELITGCILAGSVTNVDLSKWLKNMKKLYSTKFKTLTKFESYALDNFTNIFENIQDEYLYSKYPKDSVIAAYAQASYLYLVDCERSAGNIKNEYLDVYYRLLEDMTL